MATNWDTFFKSEKENPSAWSIGGGSYAGASVSSDLFSRDEKTIVDAAKKHGFTVFKTNHSVRFKILDK